jgi:hypothetical protein
VSEQVVVLVVISVIVFAGLGVLWMAMANRRAVREMEHRERLAMIQRGLVPAPESDPLGFEAMVGPYEEHSLRNERWRTAGTLTIGLGLALATLLLFSADDPQIGFGIGGAFTVLGTAILLNGLQLGRSRRPASRPFGARRDFSGGRLPPSEPPGSVGP